MPRISTTKTDVLKWQDLIDFIENLIAKDSKEIGPRNVSGLSYPKAMMWEGALSPDRLWKLTRAPSR